MDEVPAWTERVGVGSVFPETVECGGEKVELAECSRASGSRESDRAEAKVR